MNGKAFANIDNAMCHLLDRIMTHGAESAPRGKKIRELLGESISVNMCHPIVTKLSRKIGYRFYAAEASWILQGRNDMGYFKKLGMDFIWQFSDDGAFYNGAYGPRVIDQLTYVCDMLSDDHDTRQAVIEVWRPNPRPSRDIPCTLSYQFIARDGLLHCVQSMRSSDAWLGYPYDVFNASMLTLYVILLLKARAAKGRTGLKLGNHTMHIGSSHVYEPQWDSALTMIDDSKVAEYEAFDPDEFKSPAELIDWLEMCAANPCGVDPRE